jgi:hypothetical protein
MFKKVCFSPNSNVKTHSNEEIRANPQIVDRFTKLAKNLKSIAPKSDDFLYFSIIFLKAAESALLDNNGNIKKVGSEDAWGFFDENWNWHGNVKPHRNNNKDIFPEAQLKLATPLWVGKPLCRDHESSSVDGIRGIILDTYYDEKYKQVVGLCALDKVNYPSLAAKVQSGLVRYGSMGTAVETSICTECYNRARTQDEYCQHVLTRTAHGEINVGLKPIEYSLVVTPAEPGAVLLKCIASLNEYRQEFVNYGVEDVPEMLGKLSEKQAQHLEGIMKTACGDDGCSITDRRRIVTSFLSNNGLIKSADIDVERAAAANNVGNAVKTLSDITDGQISDNVSSILEQSILEVSVPSVGFTSGENVSGEKLPGDVSEFSAASSRIGLPGNAVDSGDNPDFDTEGDLLRQTTPPGEALTGLASKKDVNVRNGSINDVDFDNLTISSILEDIMNESRLKKRAELRRRIAYMQGGSEGREPNTYKSEQYSWDHDKQMHQDGNMGGDSGMMPGDSEVKEKLSRAELNERRIKRMAYMQGGSEGREPNTYKSEPFAWDHDKQMHQTGNMGGDSGMFPGDSDTKEKVSRAAYNGPALSTRFLVKRSGAGSVDRANSVFQVFAGDKKVIQAKASEIFGPELNENWDWLRSREYGKEVCSQIREAGLSTVSSLLKSAQELPPAEELPAEGAAAELPPMDDAGAAPELPPMDDAPMDDAPMDDMGGEDEPADPAAEIDTRLSDMEKMIDEVRDLVDELQDERMADVDVNVFTGKGKGGEEEQVETEMTALSREIVNNLKTAFAKLDSSADELAMVGETYENIAKLSNSQAKEFRKLASEAVRDADQIAGEVRGLVRIASAMKENMGMDRMEDAASYAEDMQNNAMCMADDCAIDGCNGDHGSKENSAEDGAVEELITAAMDLRKSRRESLLKQAEDRVLSQRKQSREDVLKLAMEMADDEAEDGADDTDENAVDSMMADDALDSMASSNASSALKTALAANMKKAEENDAREAYRVKLRRAYDVGLDMQRKGLLPTTKTALDKQVDEIMDFDDRAFESFKRSIASARPVRNMKIASDLGGVNIGVEDDSGSKSESPMTASSLSSLWD